MYMNLVKQVFISARSTTWLRIVAEILLGFAVAPVTNEKTILNFFITFVVIGPLLWTAAYILNDYSDREVDQFHPLRKLRPIASGKISVIQIWAVIIFLTCLAWYANVTFLDGSLTVIMVLLMLSQLSYTLKPVRLKEKVGFDIIINSFNSALRLIAGFLAGNGNINQLPFFILFFLIFFKALLFLGHRYQSREIDIKNNLNSTVKNLSSYGFYFMLVILAMSMIISYILDSLQRQLEWKIVVPPLIAGIILLPDIFRKTYIGIHSYEKNINFRVKIYIAFLCFAIAYLFILKVIK